MRIHVPVPEESAPQPSGSGERRTRGAIGVIDNSKPRFDVVASSALEALTELGFTHSDAHYVRKPSPTRPAEPGEIERLSEGTVAVLIGSGD
jgi:hypothetical protein